MMAAAGLAACVGNGVAQAQGFAATLSGFAETGPLNAESGAILTAGTGTFSLRLDTKTQTAIYSLTFSNLTSLATMAHIHFAREHVPGGILVWLCQTHVMPSPVPGTPFCPRIGGTVGGTITGSKVVAIPGQNVTAGDFAALVAALDSGTAYVNVHSVKFESGELRGEIVRVMPAQ
jgi:hypothetical protein